MYLVVGLGNPGKQYEATRHNMGFDTIDVLVERHKINSIHNMNGIKRTDLYAASKSTASVITCLCTAIWNKRKHLTVFHTCVNIVIFCLFTGSGTFHMCYLTGSFHNCLSHNSCNYFSNRLTAYRTAVYRSFSFCN